MHEVYAKDKEAQAAYLAEFAEAKRSNRELANYLSKVRFWCQDVRLCAVPSCCCYCCCCCCCCCCCWGLPKGSDMLQAGL